VRSGDGARVPTVTPLRCFSTGNVELARPAGGFASWRLSLRCARRIKTGKGTGLLAGRGGVGRWITVWVGGRRPLAARRQQAPSPRVVVRPRTATASTAGRRARPGLLGSVPVTKSLANNFLVVKAVRVETYESNVRKRQRVGVGVLRSCVSGGRRHRLWAVRVVVIGLALAWPGRRQCRIGKRWPARSCPHSSGD
jgi:hypothetical protein